MTQRDCYDCYYSKLDGEKEPCKSCKATDEGFTNWREVPPTNADRIRAMSDEELAEFLAPSFTCYACPSRALCDKSDGKDCNQVFLEWLKQPYEEGLHGNE